MPVKSFYRNLLVSRKTLHACVLILLVLCALANFYRNRDPYKAYIHSRSDNYLTTHLLDSDFDKKCNELEYRLSGKISPNFYGALHQLYKDKHLILPNDILFDLKGLAENSGMRTSIEITEQILTEQVIDLLLHQASYSFFYSPLIFSPYKSDALTLTHKTKKRQCLEFRSPWKNSNFPLLMVLLPPALAEDSVIRVVHYNKYLFFIPSQHPSLKAE